MAAIPKVFYEENKIIEPRTKRCTSDVLVMDFYQNKKNIEQTIKELYKQVHHLDKKLNRRSWFKTKLSVEKSVKLSMELQSAKKTLQTFLKIYRGSVIF